MIHVLRDVVLAASRINKKEVAESVTIIETSSIVAISVISYNETVQGIKPFTTPCPEKLLQKMVR